MALAHKDGATLYWTRSRPLLKVAAMNSHSSALVNVVPRLLLATLSALVMAGARADNLSAPAAAAALSAGALVWDVRSDAQDGLPGAQCVEPASLQAWLDNADLAELQAAVSRAGLDLSRDIVIYGEAGDLRAQALVASLQSVSRGRLHWLVGGATEWAMSGRALRSAPAARLPVPQHLVAPQALQAAAVQTMASAALRAARVPDLLAAR